jgi:excinuclease ABC subunit A
VGKDFALLQRPIVLRGVSTHNLQAIDLDLPRGQLIVFCGVSGSGKTSLALDTLYAEGQRRYIESFSAYTRQFLERLEKPEAERIDGIPPAVAVTRKNIARSSRATLGAATETIDYLRLLFAKIGRVFCQGCGQEVRRESPQSAAAELEQVTPGTRFLVTFRREANSAEEFDAVARELKEDGFIRAILHEQTMNLAEGFDAAREDFSQPPVVVHAVVDRLRAGSSEPQRVRDSLEIAFEKGGGACQAFVETAGEGGVTIDEQSFHRLAFSTALRCEACGKDYIVPEPRLFSFNSPLGACPRCEGFGNVLDVDLDLVVPDRDKSLREGAIAPWTTPAYAHELQELLDLAGDYDLPVDVPFRLLNEQHLKLIQEGVPERNFGGLAGFFQWLERRKYKTPIRVFLSRWRSERVCPECHGARLRPEALAVRLGANDANSRTEAETPPGKNIAELCDMKISDALAYFRALTPSDRERRVGGAMFEQVENRLRYLDAVGLGYLALDRTLKTLSGGEAQRAMLTSALGSSLVHMLYVLDEPTAGLHPSDVERLLRAVEGLRNRGNTVAVVEHEEHVIRAADWVVEIGPGAGDRGGKVVFQGPPQDLLTAPGSVTGDFLAGRRGVAFSDRRPTNRGWVKLVGARGNNLRNLTVEFPLGVLCLVTGVSGAGKSTLVEETLYPALCRRKKKESPKPAPYDDVIGDGQIDEVLLIDQSPVARSPRSNPVTYIKAFDEIRNVFASVLEARTRNYTASHFSFNVEGGRCNACEGDGHKQIDMQFLADVYIRCPVCHGTRYRKEILDIRYRGRNIADVLEMTAREAFSFFRGQTKVQAKLKPLMDVGLDYLRLGQPATTLSGGEAQRLKLASFLSSARRARTLFLLDEPTTGLHFADVTQLLDCFDALIGVGHSLIVVEHNLQLMRAADYLIDLGPGPGDEGGQVIARGTPEEVAGQDHSATGRALRASLATR